MHRSPSFAFILPHQGSITVYTARHFALTMQRTKAVRDSLPPRTFH